MKTMGPAGGRCIDRSANQKKHAGASLAKLRHDIRNHLNCIKLSCALLRRPHEEDTVEEAAREIDRSADGINELITRFMGDADAPTLLQHEHDDER